MIQRALLWPALTILGSAAAPAGSLVIPAQTIAPPNIRNFTSSGELKTAESASGVTVLVRNNAGAIVWSGTRVVLKSGFHSENGAFIWAATDADMDGYSDLEEATDSDGDGMFDAWEIDHHLNPFNAGDATADTDGDGMSNLQEFLAGRDPSLRADGLPLPANTGLVISTSGNTYFGIDTTTWSIQAVSSP